MIVVTGASGTVGSAVLNELRKNHANCRAVYRNQENARNAPADVEVALAEFADKIAVRKAVEGAESVFLVCSPVPDLVELETGVLDVCKASGVSHIVLNSALGAGDYPKSFPAWHRKVEDYLKASGMGYTILRPNAFMQNILAYDAPSIRTDDAFYAAMGEARTSFLDVRDIAAGVARIALSPSEFNGQTYELNGPEAITNAELAERISRVARRTIKYVDIPEAAQRKSMEDMGMPKWQVDALLDLQRYYTGGQGGEVTDVLPRLLGRAPETVDEFLKEFAESFNSRVAVSQ